MNEQKPERKYIEVKYDDVTRGYLQAYCLDNGFDLSVNAWGQPRNPEDFDFHSTVWFTTSKHDMTNRETDCYVRATPKNFALFGPREDILVLEIDSPDLEEIRSFYGILHNMEDEWPDYRPHITLSYKYIGELPEIDLPDIDLIADQLFVKSLRK